jgi:hypothetical protein
MVWAIIGLTAALLLAPTRGLLLRYWFLVLPGIVGAVFGLRYATAAVAQGGPAVLLILAPLLAAGILAGAFFEVFGSKSGRNRENENER